MEEGLQIALETDLRAQPVHLLLDARDFVESDGMDLVGRLVGGCHQPHAIGVPGIAIGQRVIADGVAGLGQIIIMDVAAQLAEGRHQLVGDQMAVRVGQALAISIGKLLRHAIDRPPEQRVLWLVLDHRIQLRNHFHHQHLGLGDAGLDAFAHVADGLLEQHRKLARARQPVVVILHRLERLRAGAGAEHDCSSGEIAELIDRLQFAGKAIAVEMVLQVAQENLVGQQRLAIEAVGTDRFGLLLPAQVEVVILFAVFGREKVGQLVVVARIADKSRLQRIELERFLPEIRIQRVELRGFRTALRHRDD